MCTGHLHDGDNFDRVSPRCSPRCSLPPERIWKRSRSFGRIWMLQTSVCLPDCLYTTLRVTESHFDPCQAMPHVTEVVSFRKVLLHFRRNAGLNRPTIGFQSSRDAWGRLESLSGRREDEYSRTFSTNTISVKAHHVTYAARRSHVLMREPP